MPAGEHSNETGPDLGFLAAIANMAKVKVEAFLKPPVGGTVVECNLFFPDLFPEDCAVKKKVRPPVSVNPQAGGACCCPASDAKTCKPPTVPKG